MIRADAQPNPGTVPWARGRHRKSSGREFYACGWGEVIKVNECMQNYYMHKHANKGADSLLRFLVSPMIFKPLTLDSAMLHRLHYPLISIFLMYQVVFIRASRDGDNAWEYSRGDRFEGRFKQFKHCYRSQLLHHIL